MSDSVPDPGSGKPAPRGEAAWKAAKEGVAARNAAARRAAKRQREAGDALAARERADAHRREMADLTKGSKAR
jgi:hypothetical protein